LLLLLLLRLRLQMTLEGPQKLAFTIPLMEPLPPQYYVRMVSDNWLHVSEG
jgi:activating signal cointegrator complex subunit 3